MKVQQTVMLNVETVLRLDKVKKKTGTNKAEIIQAAVDKYLDENFVE